METLNFERIVKGKAVQADGIRIVPLVKRSCLTAGSDSQILAFGVMEPVGIQILTTTEQYVLDLEGRRSAELANLVEGWADQ